MADLNILLNSSLDLINEDNKDTVMTFIKNVVVPAMCQEKLKPGSNEPKTEQVTLNLDLPTKKTQTKIKPVLTQSKNGHKSEMKRKLEDWEKDLIRSEFINLNGQIHEDACLEIKSKLSEETAIFQVTGFISQLHKYVVKGELELADMGNYYAFQDQKKNGDIDFQSGGK